AADAARVGLFRNLLSLDLEYRVRRGERPDDQSYRAKFPELAGVVDSVFRSKAAPPISSGQSGQGPVDPNGPTRVASVAACNAPHLPGARLDYGPIGDHSPTGYEVYRVLGRGGMGVVLEARQVALNRAVALKLIRSGSFASEAELLRFQNEAESVAQLDHPNIVPIYEIGLYKGQSFFSMKLIAGTGLDKRLGDFTALPRGAARLVAVV